MSFGASTSAIFSLTLCVHHIVPIFSLNDLALLLVFEEESCLFCVDGMAEFWRSHCMYVGVC